MPCVDTDIPAPSTPSSSVVRPPSRSSACSPRPRAARRSSAASKPTPHSSTSRSGSSRTTATTRASRRGGRPAMHADGGVAVAAPAPALDQHGTRRAARTAIVDGAEILIDGGARATDRSLGHRRAGPLGGGAEAQPASARVDGRREADAALSGDGRLGDIRAARRRAAPRYRAGLAFSGADADSITEYATRHRRREDQVADQK